MPELPEVETIRLGLSRKVTGHMLMSIRVLNPKTFQGSSTKLAGQTVTSVWRRAKILGLSLTGNLTLLFHLKMSGQLIFIGEEGRLTGGHPTPDMAGQQPNNSTRAILEFDSGMLYFNDQRKFGWIKLVNNEQLAIDGILTKLGPEPLDKNFTWQILKQKLLRHKTLPVKSAIMDQTSIAGVGNIYASEALFEAKINPKTKVKDLTDEQYQMLYGGIVLSLQTGINHGGSSRAHFVNAEGEKGYFLDYAFVYGKNGQACRRCDRIIQKIQLNGRGTYFCPHCQPPAI